MKKLLAFVLTFGLVCAMTTTVGCGKKDKDAPATDAAKKDTDTTKKKDTGT